MSKALLETIKLKDSLKAIKLFVYDQWQWKRSTPHSFHLRVNDVDDTGSTVLHLAAQQYYAGSMIVDFLIHSAGANATIVNKEGNTALHYAAMNRNTEVATEIANILIAAAPAIVNIVNAEGASPLHFAAENGLVSIISLLINAGANINATDKDGGTALSIAIRRGYTNIVQSLIEVKADVNLANGNGFTPLHLAFQYNPACVVMLLNSNANISAVNKDGISTPLHLAIRTRHEEMMLILQMWIKKNADVNIADEDGFTPLHLAAQFDLKEMMQALIKAKAEVNAVSKTNFTPLMGAAQRKLNAVVSNNLTLLSPEASKNEDDFIKTLISAGSKVNMTTSDGWAALHYAAQHGNRATINVLLEAGANINAVNDDGDTPLHCAIHFHSPYVDTLIMANANVNIVNKNGNTALHLAVEKNQKLALKLIARGIPTNILNKSNLSAEDILRKQKPSLYQYLCLAFIEMHTLNDTVKKRKQDKNPPQLLTNAIHTPPPKNVKSRSDTASSSQLKKPNVGVFAAAARFGSVISLTAMRSAANRVQAAAGSGASATKTVLNSPRTSLNSTVSKPNLQNDNSTLDDTVLKIVSLIDAKLNNKLSHEAAEVDPKAKQEEESTEQKIKQNICLELGKLIMQNSSLFQKASLPIAQNYLKLVEKNHPEFQLAQRLLYEQAIMHGADPSTASVTTPMQQGAAILISSRSTKAAAKANSNSTHDNPADTDDKDIARSYKL